MIIKIGHRGVWGYKPENTICSFKKALEFDIDMVEFDVFACKTGEVVVIHDYRIDRTTEEKGYVQKKTFEELRRLDAGKGQKIPTLQEVLNLIDKKVKVNIELKGEGSAKPVYEIIERYIKENGWKKADFLISSFNHYDLREFNRFNSEIKIGAVIAGIPIGYAECAQKVNAYSLHASKEFINKALVDDAHKRGMKLFVYTVNEPEDIERVKLFGVDGIFSDFPDRL